MPASSRPLLLLILAFCVVCTTMAWPQVGSAQGNSSQNALLKRASTQLEEARNQPLGPSAVKPVTVNVQWQLWKKVVTDRKEGLNELVSLNQSLRSRGQRNHPVFTLGAIALLKQEEISGPQAAKASAHIWMISPDMPHGYLAHAYWNIRHNPSAIGPIALSISKGVPRLWTWPDMGTMWRYNLMGILMLALMLASFGFLLAQTIRHFGTLCFDANRLMPKSMSQFQTTVLMLAVIVIPGVVLGSPVLIALTLLGLLGIVQQVRERVVTLMLFALLAMLPIIEKHMSHEATFHTSDAHVMFGAQYIECQASCAKRLEVMHTQRPKDSVLMYTQLLLALRQGHPQTQLDEWSTKRVLAMPKAMHADAMNLYGASLAARMKHTKAIEALTLAVKLDPTRVGPHINLMRVAQAQDKSAEISAHLKQANTLNLMGTTAFLELKRRDTNSMLWVEPLAQELFMQHSIHVEGVKTLPVISRVWPSLAGRTIPFGWSVYMGGAGILVVLLTLTLAIKTHISTPCPKCGLPRAPSDGAMSGDHAYCMMCYKTYIDGVGMTPQQRSNSENRISSRQGTRRLITQVLSMLLPGTGHALAGHAVFGFLLSVVFFIGVMFVLRPHGVWPASHALLEIDWFGLRALSWICLGSALLVGVMSAWRGMFPPKVRTRKHPFKGASRD